MTDKLLPTFKNLVKISDRLFSIEFGLAQLLDIFLELVTLFGAIYLCLVIFLRSADHGFYAAMVIGVFLGAWIGAVITRLILVQLLSVTLSMVGFLFFRKALKAEKDRLAQRVEQLEVKNVEAQ
jgi:hypothetical protein